MLNVTSHEAKVQHLGIVLTVVLSCFLGGWTSDRYSDGGKLAGAAIGLFSAFGVILLSSIIAAAKRHGWF